MKNILVLTLTRIGDLIQGTPLISGLRAKYPDAKITQMVSSDFAEFAKRIPVDETIVLNLRQFENREHSQSILWVDVYQYLEQFMEELKSRQFDLVVNLSHSKLSAFINLYLNPKDTIGFACNKVGDRMALHPWMQFFGIEPFNRAYNPFNLVEIFARCGGTDPAGQTVKIDTRPDDAKSVEGLMAEKGIRSDDFLIGVQAGSSLEGRRWPAGYFAELIDSLTEKMGAKVILFGVKGESELVGTIHSAVKNKDRVVDLTGQTNITQLTAMLPKCKYLVTNDTGTMHIAAALGVKIVGLFFAHAHPYETGPYAPGHLIFQSRISCAPCSYGVQCNNIICIHSVQPKHVFAMMEGHDRTGNWEWPGNWETPVDLNLVKTEWDHEKRLRLIPLLKHPLELTDIFRESYYHFWPMVLDGKMLANPEETGAEIVRFLNENYDCGKMDKILDSLEKKKKELEELIQNARKGIKAGFSILKNLSGKKGKNLQMLVEEIEKIDGKIKEIGFSHPEVKPVAEMFSKRKENFQGDDPLQLTKSTIQCYQRLEAESRELLRVLEHIAKKFSLTLNYCENELKGIKGVLARQ